MEEGFDIWIEVDYTVEVVEKGTRIIKLRVPKYYDQCTPGEFKKYAQKIVESSAEEVFDDEDFLKFETVKVDSKIIRAYTDVSSGGPNIGRPIDLDP